MFALQGSTALYANIKESKTQEDEGQTGGAFRARRAGAADSDVFMAVPAVGVERPLGLRPRVSQHPHRCFAASILCPCPRRRRARRMVSGAGRDRLSFPKETRTGLRFRRRRLVVWKWSPGRGGAPGAPHPGSAPGSRAA